MSNPIYRWLYQGVPHAGIPGSLPESVLNVALGPLAHPTARAEAQSEMDRRVKDVGPRLKRIEDHIWPDA